MIPARRCFVALAMLFSHVAEGAAGQRPADQWQPLQDMPIAVRSAAVATDGARVYAVGGTSVSGRTSAFQVLTLRSNSWETLPDYPIAVDWASAAWVGGRLHVFGGVTDSGRATAAHFVFDETTSAWTRAPSLPRGVAGSAAVVLGGEIHLFGGNARMAPTYTADVFAFDAGQQKWRTAPSVPDAGINWASAASSELAYLVGGQRAELRTSSDIWEYSPDERSWLRAVRLRTAREAHAVGAVGRIVCAVGGRVAAPGNFSRPFGDTECFRTGVWERVDAPALPVGRQELAGVSVPSGIVVVGGADETGRPTGEAWFLAFPVS